MGRGELCPTLASISSSAKWAHKKPQAAFPGGSRGSGRAAAAGVCGGGGVRCWAPPVWVCAFKSPPQPQETGREEAERATGHSGSGDRQAGLGGEDAG